MTDRTRVPVPAVSCMCVRDAGGNGLEDDPLAVTCRSYPPTHTYLGGHGSDLRGQLARWGQHQQLHVRVLLVDLLEERQQVGQRLACACVFK